MAERIQKKVETTRTREEHVEDVAPVVGEAATKLKTELDELLDEIDGVLETNAEDFVKSYVQKGGE